MMLAQYEKILVPGGILEFKTDNDDLFDFSLDEFKAAGFELLAMTRDLHMSPYAAENVPTEYEDKFAGSGKSINFARVRVR
jgi:tRNA (guanine-N7-)-methyltransferase